MVINKLKYLFVFLFLYFGIIAQDINMQNGTFNLCNGTFFDSGGDSGDYSSNENFVITICPDMPEMRTILEYVSFELADGDLDTMSIYDSDTADPATLIDDFSGSLLNADNSQLSFITASDGNLSGCLTIEFNSSANNEDIGWEALISCRQACPIITLSLDSLTPASFNGEAYELCFGDQITFDANAELTVGDPELITYSWDFDDGDTSTGEIVTNTFPEPGFYDVILTAEYPDCESETQVFEILVSDTPEIELFTEFTEICLGDSVELSAVATPTAVTRNCGIPFSGEVLLPDSAGVPFTSSILVECFEPNQTITNANDVLEVCMVIEHSFLDDIDIVLIAPNGTEITLVDAGSTGQETYLGEAVDDESGTPGTGYLYCFTLDASTLLADGATVEIPNPTDEDPENTTPAIVPGDYLPVESFDNLIGEPLNGDWNLQITDNIIQDDGFLFEWYINFDSSIIPIENIFEPQIIKEEWIGYEGQGPVINFTSFEEGNFCFEYEVVDEFFCVFIEEICIDVLPLPSIDFVEDIFVCNSDPSIPTMFDLTINDENVYGTQDPDNFILTYHLSQSDATDGLNAIENPESFETSNAPQTIFVRLFSINGECVSTDSFQLIDSGEIENIPPLRICSETGVAFFDLTQQYQEVLSPGQNLNTYTVTFHNSQVDANLDINDISESVDITNYENSSNPETIWVRVENNENTACFDVGSFEIIANLQPIINEPPSDIIQCTTVSQSFDLTVNNATTLGLSIALNSNITYHETLEDASSGSNPIDNPENYSIDTNLETVWVRVENFFNATCFVIAEFNLEIITSAPVNTNPTPLIECDDDNDGFFNNFDLTDKDDEIGLNNPSINISYFLTEEDAINNIGALSSPYSNVVENVQTIYFRTEDTDSGCIQVSSFEIQVVDSPLLTPLNQPLVGCDDNDDGVMEFDLTQVEFEALGNLNPNDLDITYHVTLLDAQNDTFSIAQPTMFQNTSNPQTVWIRVEDIINNNGCFDIEPIELQVFNAPEVAFAEPFAVCDDETGGDLSDEIATFDLNEVVNEITQVNNELLVEFFETPEDLANNNPINPIDSFVNTSNPQTIQVRVTSETTGCITTSSFTIVVEPTPSLDPTLEPLEICDPDNDGFAEFDLAAAIPDILNNEPEVTITFHLTQAQADLGTNPIDTSILYGTNNPNQQTLYVRAENTGPNGDDGSGCYDTRPLDLIVNSSPEIIELDDLSRCDDESANGFSSFDLTENNVLALGSQNPDDVNITYHETQEFAEQGINPIAVPTNYTNLSNPQTIYVRLENPETGCFDLYNSSNDVNNTFTLSVEALPEINTPTDLEKCDDDNSDSPFPQTVFDLTVKEPEIAGVTIVPDNLIFTYYKTQADLDNDLNPIPDPTQYTNANQPQDIFIKIVDGTTENQCFNTTVMTINVLPLPSPSETDPDVLRLEACDDNNDGIATSPFDLTVSGVLIAESENVVLSYYTSETGAEIEDLNDLISDPTAYFNDPSLNLSDENGVPTNIQIIYVRVDNNVDGNFCFVVVPIELQVNPAPELNPNGDPFAYTLCEDDPENPGTATIFSIEDITNNLWDLNNGTSNTIIPLLDPDFSPIQNIEDFTISYHQSEDDAENGINPVLPGDQADDGDILFIRVVNIETLCFNTDFIRQVRIVIEPRPAIADENPDDLTICAETVGNTNSGTVDLTVQDEFINPGEPVNTMVVYYAGMMDYNNAVSISDPANYQTSQTPQTIIAEVINTLTLCESASFLSFDIIVNPLPNVDISGFDGFVVCFDENGTLVINDQSPPVIDTGLSNINLEFIWELDGVIQSETSPSITATSPGTYTVTVTNEITGCTASSSATIIESAPPIFDVTVISPSFTDNHVIEVTVTEGSGDFEFQLDDGEWISLAPGETTLTFTNVAPGTHIIRGRDQGGCGTVEVMVSLIDYPRFLTPNEDGFNDTWNITSLSDIENSGIFIFDRYGKLLKQISPSGEGWDGTFNGKPMPSQSYWFRVEFTEPATGNKTTFRSHFVLKR